MFVRIKKFKNPDGSTRKYLNLVENKKIKGKVVQTTLCNFGRLEDGLPTDKIDRLIHSLMPFSSKFSFLDPSNDTNPKN